VKDLLSLCCFAALAATASAQINIQLSRETRQAFDDYVKAAESKLDGRAHLTVSPSEKLVIQPSGDQTKNDGKPIEVKDGLIHDWTAAVLVPNATVEKALAVLQDYNGYRKIYSPQVIESRLLEHNGNKFRVYLKLNKSKGLVTVVLDSEYDVEYQRLPPNINDGEKRWAKLSRSTRINEIQFGKMQPVDTGVGFLWRMNAYWLIEPRPGGVYQGAVFPPGIYMECRSISLSRDIPPGLGWMIKPVVTTLPRESLRDTMTATAAAITRQPK
jgi:hypothetical protein